MSDTNVGNTNNVNSKHNDTDINTINSRKSRDDDHNIVAQFTKDGAEPEDRIKLEEADNDKLPPIPDGGWGWVIVLLAFFISSCINGLAFCFGLLHEEITLYFQTTQAKTSLIGSLFVSVPLLAGPIMSALVDRFGCRLMTMVAGITSATGFILAAFSNSIEMLCVTFGIISGLGNGIMYVTVVVSIAFWFDKKRNFAFSLAYCGVGFGTIILSPMTAYFLRKYDWRNTLLLLAGILLNMCVCGALMRKPEWLEIKQKREKRLKARSRKLLIARSATSSTKVKEVEELKSLLKSEKSPESILMSLTTNLAEAKQLEATAHENRQQRMQSTIHLPTFVQQNEKVPTLVTDKLITNKKLYNIILQNYPDVLTCRHSTVNLDIDNQTTPKLLAVEIKTKKSKETNVQEEKNGTFDEEQVGLNDKFRPNHNNLKSKHETVNRDDWLSKISTEHNFLNMPFYRSAIKSTSLPNMNRNSSWSLVKETGSVSKWYHRLWNLCKTTFDIKLFTEFHFLMFNISMLILSVSFVVPFFFLTSYMTDVNTDGGATIMSIIGVSSIISLVLLGWTGDQPWINVNKMFSICLIICGLSVAAFPIFIVNFWMLSVVTVIFGLSVASSFAYTSGLLMQMIPLDHMAVGVGLQMLIQGLGHFLGPPIGGFLYDVTGSWELTFYVAGAWIVVSGLCIAVIAYTEDRRICGKEPLLMEIERAKSKTVV